VPNEQHAAAAVRAAIDAQRAIYELNVKREAENPARETENRERVAAGLPPRPLNVSLQLGTGINSGPRHRRSGWVPRSTVSTTPFLAAK